MVTVGRGDVGETKLGSWWCEGDDDDGSIDAKMDRVTGVERRERERERMQANDDNPVKKCYILSKQTNTKKVIDISMTSGSLLGREREKEKFGK